MSFLNPFWLFALVTVSIPIIIHLLNRFRHRTIDWAAMDFLLRAMSKQRRRLQMETLILLVIRTAAVLAIALAMARPLATGAARLVAGGIQRRLAVLVDVSASMSAQSAAGRTLLNEAREAGRLTVEHVSGCREAELIAFDSRCQTIFRGSPSHLAAQGENIFARIGQSYGEGRPARAIQEALTHAEESPESAYTLVMVTDAQRSNWTSTSKADWDAIARRAHALKNTPALVVLVEKAAKNENLAVTEMSIPGWSLMGAESPLVHAQVANFGSTAGRGQLSLYDGEALMGRPLSVSLAAGESADFEFPLSLDQIKTGRLACQVEGDAFKADNRRCFPYDPESKIQILLVNGAPDPVPSNDAVFRLKTLLVPEETATAKATAVRTISPSELSKTDLSRYQSVVLANVAAFSPADAETLTAFLRAGGQAVIFLGDRVNPDNYNKVLYAQGNGPLPCELRAARSGDPVRMQARKSSGEILQRLDSFGIGLESVSTRSFFEVKSETIDKSSVIVAEYGDDHASPAVIQKSFGRGMAVLFTASADARWSNLPLDPSGAVFLYETIAQAAATSNATKLLDVGRPIEIDWPLEEADGAFTVTGPEDLKSTLHAKPQGGRYRLIFEDTTRPGFYEIRSGTKTSLVAANVSAAESDPAPIGARQIEAMLPGLPVKLIDASESTEAAMVAEGEMGALWPALIALAAALFILELALAQHFSRIR